MKFQKCLNTSAHGTLFLCKFPLKSIWPYQMSSADNRALDKGRIIKKEVKTICLPTSLGKVIIKEICYVKYWFLPCYSVTDLLY